MSQKKLHLLNPRNGVGRHPQFNLAESGHFTSIASRKTDGVDTRVGGGTQGSQHVGRAPRGGQSHQYIPGASEGSEGAGQTGFVAVVIADRSEDRGIGIESDTSQSRAIVEKTADQLTRQVLAVGRTAAVAAEKNRAPARE